MMEKTLKGGYRADGRSPVAQPGLPVVSVITVVYNSLNLIEKTIRSILGQTYPNIEFIVIDGGSTDGTVDIIRRHEKQISWWISEPDHGIYDAMNKGLAAATGNYVWFINAGDRIYATDTLEKIFDDPSSQTRVPGSILRLGKIYYGDTMIVDSGFHELGLRRLRPPEILTWRSFRKGMLVSHQAIIVSRDIAPQFDPQYRHSADFDWVVRALKKAVGSRQSAVGRRQEAVGSRQETEEGSSVAPAFRPGGTEPGGRQVIVNTHLILCAFLDGGHSKQHIGISLRERFHSMVHHYGLVPTVLRHIPIAVRFGWYYLMNKRF